MEEKRKVYAFYSAKAHQKHSFVVYQKPDGTNVKVTCITEDPLGDSYHWPDKVFLGEATDWIYQGGYVY